MRSRFPDFLIVGAMKSGTTSLYFDLLSHPGIFLPDEKEPNSLASDEVTTPAGRSEYARLFRGARPDQICGEASTAYTKVPDVTGVPRRAREVCGGELKAIYLVREPVARIVSHHYHEVTAGTMEPDIDEAVRRRPRLLDYTRYARQIAPWIDTFGRERVKIVVFERYIGDRRGSVGEIARFLGVEPAALGPPLDEVHNRSAGKPAPKGIAWRATRGSFYRRWLRPLVPSGARRRLRHWLQPVAPPPPAPPSPATVDWIFDRLGGELEALRGLLGLSEPVWDFARVRSRYATSAMGESVVGS